MKLPNFSLIVISIVMLTLQSCSSSKNNVYWINSFKSDCVGVGPMKCLNVYKGEDLENAKWQNFYSKIEGFNFEEGMLTKIKVKEEKLNPENVPADASSIKYTLVEVLEKKEDSRMHLNGNWILATLDGNPINRMVKIPTLEIDIAKQLLSGNGGCNNYTSSIKSLTLEKIELYPVVSTKKACINKNIENEYLKLLNSIKSYTVQGEKLTLYNQENKEILSFLKKN
ncbi:MAG: DUF4377 domain-containing protein [Flavobacteriales bacterium]|nr:DUF4377 domain-containing protein [Flavobacteriales bacterium]